MKKIPVCMQPEKQKRIPYTGILIYTASFLIPVFILLLIFSKLHLFPFGNNSFLINDMKWQYADMLAYQRTLLNGSGSLFYSFSRTLGGNMLSTWAYYLANPINLLVLLFRPDALPKAISLILLLKFGASGVTSCFYLRKSISRDPAVLIFSSAYALMAYTLLNAENFQFLDGVILLPLVARGIEQIIDNHSPRLYILSLFCVILFNFYIGWMVCIFSVLYFLFKVQLKQAPITKSCIPTFIVSSLLAAGLSAILLIPTAFQLSESVKEFDPSVFSFSFNFSPPQLLSKFYTGAFDADEIKNGGLPAVFSGVFPSILFFLFFFNQAVSRKEKKLTFLFSAFILLSFFFKPLDLFWHGLNQPRWWSYRYSFLFSFMIISTGFRSLTLLNKDSLKKIYIYLCIAASIIVSGGFYLFNQSDSRAIGYLNKSNLCGDSILTILFCMLLLLKCSNQRALQNRFIHFLLIFSLLVLSGANLAANAYTYLKIKTEDQQPVDAYQAYWMTLNPVLSKIKQDDPDLFRIEKLFYRSYNDSMQFDTYGISHFNSFSKPDLLNLIQKLGYASYRYVTNYSYGSTVFADSILGIKYLLTGDPEINKPYSEIFEKNGIRVFQNPYAMSFGFLASDKISDFVIRDENLFEIQNSLFSHLTGEESAPLYTEAEISKIDWQNLSVQIDGKDIKAALIDQTQKGIIRWEIPANQSDFLYCFFPSQTDKSIELVINGRSLGKALDSTYSGIIPLGKFGTGETIRLELVISDPAIQIQAPLLYYENPKMLAVLLNSAKSNPVRLQKISSSHLSGNLSVDSNQKILFLSIPYEDGWKITVDGVRMKPIKVFNSLMAIPVTIGEHSIDLKYTPEGFIPGVMVSALSAILLVVISLKRKIRL